MFQRILLGALTVACLGALTASAQYTGAVTPAEVNDCAMTIPPIVNNDRYYHVDDDTHFFNLTWTYNPAICTSRIVVQRSRLVNEESGMSYACSIPQFDGSGVLNTVCNRQTLGAMARTARDFPDEAAWSFSLAYGPAPSYLLSTDFTVTPGDPPAPALEPVPSGSLQKKRRNNQHVFDCPIGHTWCWTGQGQDYACMDTSSDVSACGQCPYALGAEKADCTSIEGVDDVTCQNSKCVVQACQRGFQISLDRTSCVEGRKRSHKVSRGLIF